MDKTVEMYKQIIKNAPFGAYAAQSEFKIGLAREQQRRYTDAVDAYQKVLDNYPTSAVASKRSTRSATRGCGRPAARATTRARPARRSMPSRISLCATESDKAAQAQPNIVNLGKEQTQGAYNIAQFYENRIPPR